MNASVLPSTVLLEMFSFYVNRAGADIEAWHTLVHVCRQWRSVVFGSPRRLNLRLFCTPKRPLNMLDIWPALPVSVGFLVTGKRPRGMANIVAALKQHHRVREIELWGIRNSLMKKLAAMKKLFPELTSLKLSSKDASVPILPDSFLGGSIPRLHTLNLCGVPFPGLGKLVLPNLVVLDLWSIPRSGYISPEAMVNCLSALTALKSFVLGFQSPQSRDSGGTRRPPPHIRVVIAALTTFRFKGNSEYLEDIVSRIDTPLLDYFDITFFNQLIFDTPLLRHFIGRTEKIKAHYRANVNFDHIPANIRFSPQGGKDYTECLILRILCPCIPPDWQLSSLAQFCSSPVPPLSTLMHLEILSYRRSHWQDNIESSQWLELLYPFTSVKNLVLSDELFPFVATALQELTGERVTEVLPMLQNIHIEGPQLSNRVMEAIRQFIAARQLSGHPVDIFFDEV